MESFGGQLIFGLSLILILVSYIFIYFGKACLQQLFTTVGVSLNQSRVNKLKIEEKF